MNPVKIEIHESLEAVGPEAWQALHADSGLRSPFLTWTWQHEWLAVFGEGRRLELQPIRLRRQRRFRVWPHRRDRQPGRGR